MVWLEIAQRQGKSLSEAKRANSSQDFVLLRAFHAKQEQERIEETSKEEYYLAQIAYEIARANPKIDASRLTINHFLFKFRRTIKTKPIENDPEARMRQSKSAWGGMLGIKPEE